jgi:hypothetical protein
LTGGKNGKDRHNRVEEIQLFKPFLDALCNAAASDNFFYRFPVRSHDQHRYCLQGLQFIPGGVVKRLPMGGFQVVPAGL